MLLLSRYYCSHIFPIWAQHCNYAMLLAGRCTLLIHKVDIRNNYDDVYYYYSHIFPHITGHSFHQQANLVASDDTITAFLT